MRVLNKTKKEKQKIIDMWTYCFSDSREFIDWNFSRNFEHSQTFVAERNGEIAANLQLMPYTAKLMGEELSSVYYSGVATLPQFRNQGCVRELMTESLNMLKEKNIPIAHLIPFNYKFYEKFGFKAISDRLTLKIPIAKIPYSLTSDFELYNNVSDIPDIVVENLNKINLKMCKNANFYISRSTENLIKILEDVLINSGGYLAMNKDSYLLYEKNNEKVTVYELGFASSNGFRQALAFLGSHKAERKFAEIVTLFTPIIKTELCDIRDMLCINPFAMLRIIDAEYILKIFAKKCDTDFTIKINDEIIKENNTCFKIHNGNIEKYSKETADIETSISDLAQIVCGYITLCEAYEIGTVKIENPETLKKLEHMFKKSVNYVNLML